MSGTWDDVRFAARTFRTSPGSALLATFAIVAAALAAIGVYGAMAYAVTLRVREIGIRMAIGARRIDVLGLVLGQSLMLTGIGTVIGYRWSHRAHALPANHALRGDLPRLFDVRSGRGGLCHDCDRGLRSGPTRDGW